LFEFLILEVTGMSIHQQADTVPWWHAEGGFFNDLYMEADSSHHTFFSGAAQLDDRTAQEADGVVSLCELAAGNVVIDCPSGYGRHSIALAQRGMMVTGVDINPLFLKQARRYASNAGSEVKFVTGDMRELPSLPRADAVINMFYSFGFFTAAENLAVLRNFYEVLKPDGRFLMHTMITRPALIDGRIPAYERRQLTSGRMLELRRSLDPNTCREYGQWSILEADGSEHHLRPYDVQIYDAEEFLSACVHVGFSTATAYGDWYGSAYEPSSPYLIVVATR
jgi:ubiquinone/menaquinone biosynthesis C-methylase UbiE